MTIPEPIPFRPEGPQPLLRELAPPDPYPVNSLGPLRAAVKAAQETTQAPVALAAQSALSIASLAVQPFADVETLGGYSPVSLYCLTVARSGERKSATDKVLMRGLREFEREKAAEYHEDLRSWRNDQALWRADHDKIMAEFKKKSGNRVTTQAGLQDIGPEPSAPLTPNLTATEPTLEGLHKLFATGQPSLGVFSDEGGQFLGGHGMNADNRLKTTAGLSALWGGDAINRTRAGDGASTLHGRKLAAHLMVQPVAARPLLADPVANGQGFLARFLITEPASTIGTRLRRGNADGSDAIIGGFANHLQAILSTPKPTCQSNHQELIPRQLPLSAGARELIWQFYYTVEVAQAPGGELEGVTAFASKAPEQAARIAGVLTLWLNLNAPEVAKETMADAIMLAGYYLDEAKRLAEAAEVSADVDRAEKLRLWLLNDWPAKAPGQGREPDTFVPRDVLNAGPNALRTTAALTKPLKMLVEHGWIFELPKGTVIDETARQTAYRIVRA